MHEQFVMSKFGRIFLCAFGFSMFLFPSSVISCAFFSVSFCLVHVLPDLFFPRQQQLLQEALSWCLTRHQLLHFVQVFQEKHRLLGKYSD